jgi:hypothetical protein
VNVNELVKLGRPGLRLPFEQADPGLRRPDQFSPGQRTQRALNRLAAQGIIVMSPLTLLSQLGNVIVWNAADIVKDGSMVYGATVTGSFGSAVEFINNAISSDGRYLTALIHETCHAYDPRNSYFRDHDHLHGFAAHAAEIGIRDGYVSHDDFDALARLHKVPLPHDVAGKIATVVGGSSQRTPVSGHQPKH